MRIVAWSGEEQFQKPCTESVTATEPNGWKTQGLSFISWTCTYLLSLRVLVSCHFQSELFIFLRSKLCYQLFVIHVENKPIKKTVMLLFFFTDVVSRRLFFFFFFKEKGMIASLGAPQAFPWNKLQLGKQIQPSEQSFSQDVTVVKIKK